MISKSKLSLFEKKIDYKFKDISILNNSLTHPSYLSDNKFDEKKFNQFERLEFLGDRVLGLIIASMLFDKNISLDEGGLSKKYSYLVQKKFLYKISLKLKIEEILLFNFKKNNQKMLFSIISDSVESLIGGIFIDGGYKSAFKFVKKYWYPYLDVKISKTQDSKTLLQEISQQFSKKLPEYKLINKVGPSHMPSFTISLNVLDLVKIKANGSSIREAEQNAAKKALKLINEKKDIKN